LCKNEEIHKESPITITDWELKYDNGKYSRSVDKNQKRFITELLKEFGEPDSNCLTPGVLTMRMIATW
jgi:fatty acid-binding protein DegV